MTTNTIAIQDLLVEVLEANKFWVNLVELRSELLFIKATKNLDEIEFRLQDGVLCFKDFRIPLSYFLSNLSARGGEEQLSYVLDKLIKSSL
jgi:hypothetical protein